MLSQKTLIDIIATEAVEMGEPEQPSHIRQPPDRDGWWSFAEDGFNEQRVLIRDGHVASDVEYQLAIGVDAEEEWDDLWCENYWAGCDSREMTCGPLTTGAWKFESEG